MTKSTPNTDIDRPDDWTLLDPQQQEDGIGPGTIFLNAWFPDHDGPNAPPLTVGGTFRLHVNLGPLRGGTHVDDWKPPQPTSEESVDHVTVVVRSGWFDVKESSRRLNLPADPNNIVEFTLTAKGVGIAEFTVVFLVRNDQVERHEFKAEIRPADTPNPTP